MVDVTLHRVSIGFPILHVPHRSLKKSLLAAATGGAILQDAHNVPFIRALYDISGHFAPGDRIGLVGRNGAGKTTLLRTIAGIYEPMSGYVQTEGRIGALFDLNAGFNPELTGRENIMTRGICMGARPPEIRACVGEIEEFTELGDYLDMPIRTYSSGMQLRLAFAIATSSRPDILIMDEWLMAGDELFLKKAQTRMEAFVTSAKILVLASHSHDIIRHWCNKAMLLMNGEMKAFGDVNDVLNEYQGIDA